MFCFSAGVVIALTDAGVGVEVPVFRGRALREFTQLRVGVVTVLRFALSRVALVRAIRVAVLAVCGAA